MCIVRYILTVLTEQADGSLSKQQRQFKGFQRDVRELVAWLQSSGVQLVIMESTGIYWKSIYAALQAAGIPAHVVNARDVKNVPGRKPALSVVEGTDLTDSEWPAQLGRFGLVRPSFIPPKDLRELRLVPRYRQKLSQMQASEKNRLHKLLDDAGVKLGAVVADIDGVSARAMSEGLIQGRPVEQLGKLAKGVMRHKREVLELSLEGEWMARHRLMLEHVQSHNRYLEAELAKLDAYLIEAMTPYRAH